MAVLVFFDDEGRVKKVDKGSSPDYYNKNVAINPPTLKSLKEQEIPKKHWKKVEVERGYDERGNPTMNDVAEMSQAEKDIVDQEIADEQTVVEEARKNIDKLPKSEKVSNILMFKEINKIRVHIGLPKYTWKQFKQAYISEWNDLP